MPKFKTIDDIDRHVEKWFEELARVLVVRIRDYEEMGCTPDEAAENAIEEFGNGELTPNEMAWVQYLFALEKGIIRPDSETMPAESDQTAESHW